MPKSGGKTVINLEEKCDVHCKGYIQKSLDVAIKKFQVREMESTGENVTYSEALRRLLVRGLMSHDEGISLKYG